MVEYRRRPPGESQSRYRPAREPEPETEEGVTRAGTYATPWRRTARPTEERGPVPPILEPWQWFPGIVPGEPFFEPAAIFEKAYEPPRPRPSFFPTGAPPERGVPPRGEPRRPARRPGEPPAVDPRNWFNLEEIWRTVREWRTNPQFPKGAPVSVLKVTNPQRDEASRAAALARVFGVPSEEMARHPGRAVWTELLHPLLDEVSYAINRMKPADLPGEFGFQEAPDGSMRLGYMER